MECPHGAQCRLQIGFTDRALLAHREGMRHMLSVLYYSAIDILDCNLV
jgi:hypothetical protein